MQSPRFSSLTGNIQQKMVTIQPEWFLAVCRFPLINTDGKTKKDFRAKNRLPGFTNGAEPLSSQTLTIHTVCRCKRCSEFARFFAGSKKTLAFLRSCAIRKSIGALQTPGKSFFVFPCIFQPKLSLHTETISG